ncbi:hypothetical protein H1R20_g12269, partial [Candolleomyces eurysporus]
MLGAKRQLSQGSVDAVGPPLQRRRSSLTQAGIDRREEDHDQNYDGHYGRMQGNNTVDQYTVYYQQSSNAPIFNGDNYGSIQNNIFNLNGLQFLYQHAAMGAMHESDERYPPPLCHPGTRDVVVGRIIGWHLNKDGQRKIMWVHAPAGYGKTAVAGTVKERLDAMQLGFDGPVGATFFFWRSSPERNSPARFIITLAYQLAQTIPELCSAIQVAIKSKPGVVKMALEHQLTELIVKPFKSLPHLETVPCRLIIVDGIDECINSDRESRMEKAYAEDQEIVQIRVLDLIHRLHSHHLPLSFLILSRPEAWIKRHLESRPFRDVVEPLDLYMVGDHMNDVKRFVRAELSRMAESLSFEGADEEWPEEQALVRRSEGHMVYAATVIRHIDDPYGDPRQLLKNIVNNPPADSPELSHSMPFSDSLHELYRQIMYSCPQRNRTLMVEVLGEIMSGPLCGYTGHENALGILDRVSGRSPGCGIKALRPLHAVLWVGKGTPWIEIQELFIHSSFQEFLESPDLSFEFAVDASKVRERLLSNILDCMTSITMDTIGSGLDAVGVFALNNWCWYRTSPKCETMYLHLMKKILALDFTACIIQSYDSRNRILFRLALSPLFDSSKPSRFFVESKRSYQCEETLSMAHKVTSHVQSCLDSAFTILLQETTLPAFSEQVTECMASHCASYLGEVATEANWREHKVIQALTTPGPNGVDLFKMIIECLYEQSKKLEVQWIRDMLEHIHAVMVCEKNPILDSEDNPFRSFLYKAETDSETDSGTLKSLTSSVDSGKE